MPVVANTLNQPICRHRPQGKHGQPRQAAKAIQVDQQIQILLGNELRHLNGAQRSCPMPMIAGLEPIPLGNTLRLAIAIEK